MKQSFIPIQRLYATKPWRNYMKIRKLEGSPLEWCKPDQVLLTYMGHLKWFKTNKELQRRLQEDAHWPKQLWIAHIFIDKSVDSYQWYLGTNKKKQENKTKVDCNQWY